MSKEKPSQAINISGSSLSGNQVAQAEGNLTQTQQTLQGSTAQSLSQEEAVTLLTELENLFKTASLSSAQQEKALRYLGAAKEEAQAEKPDKQFTADSLKKFAGVLKQTNETLEAGQSIWEKVLPLLKQLLPWLGVAANFFA